MAENGLIAVRSQPQRGGPDRSRPEPDISEMARNSKDSSSFSLTTAVGRANERNQGWRLEPDARNPSKGKGSGNRLSLGQSQKESQSMIVNVNLLLQTETQLGGICRPAQSVRHIVDQARHVINVNGNTTTLLQQEERPQNRA